MTTDAELVERIDRHYRGHDRQPSRIGVAVSGGSDSLALLHLVKEWGQAEVFVATVDHGLRTGSAEEAAHVAALCEEMGVPHSTLLWRGWDGRGNLQDHARRNRYELLANWSRENGLGSVALGHTLDDQAETFVMRLGRESGLDGLACMPSVTYRHATRFDRPLLGARRDDLRGYLRRNGITWIDDPSNEDIVYDRVRVREALSTLETLGITTANLGQTIANLAQERELISRNVRDAALKLVRVSGGDLVFDRSAFRQTLPEMQRRLISAALLWIANEFYPPRRESLAQVLLAVGEKRNTSLHGCLVLVSDMAIRITREFKAVEGVVSNTDALWDGRWRFEGPHAPQLEIRVLGDGLAQCADWRETGLPRQSLVASPAVWEGDTLVSAPLAGLTEGWAVKTPNRDDFAASLISR